MRTRPQSVLSIIRGLPAAALALFVIASPLAAQDQPVVISNVRVEPNPFSPDGDGVNETTKFTFTLNRPAGIAIEILYTDTLFRVGADTIYRSSSLPDSILLGDRWQRFASDTLPKGNAPQYATRIIDGVAGVNEFIWDGRARRKPQANIIQLPDTTYTYLIRAKDSPGSRPVTGRVVIDSKPPSISTIGASPNPFSPNGDGINDQTTISFTLDGLPQNALLGNLGFQVSVDNDGNRSFEINPSTTTPAFRLTTDTLEVQFAPIALQFIKRSASSQNISFQVRGGRILDSGDTVSVVSNPITILAADPVNTVYRDATKFSFVDLIVNATGSTANIETNLVEIRTSSGAAKVDVYNSQNERVAANLPLDPPFIGNGNYTASFPENSATILPDGAYSFVITAVDESGNQVERTGTVTARSIPLSITGLTVDPDTISPANADGQDDAAVISFTLSQDARVTLQIFRDSTVFTSANLVRTLFSDSPRNAGQQNVIWDGKDGAQQFVSQNTERNYRVIVTAIDPLTQQTSEARASVFVDNLKPQELVLNAIAAATSQQVISLSGRTEPGSRVELFLGGSIRTTIQTDPLSGLFSTQNFDLGAEQGLKLIHARAFDRVGNGPTYSDSLRVVFDNVPPQITDTLIYVNGTTQRLAGRVLSGYGPADTVEIRLYDGGGRVSGVDLGRTSIQAATPPPITEIEGRLILVLPDRIRFVPDDDYTRHGSYRLTVTTYDSLGNSAAYPIPFSVGAASSGPAVQTHAMVPPLTAAGLINRNQAQPWRFSATVTDNSGTGINPNASLIELYHLPSGQRIEGSTAFTPPATFVFTSAGAVATDGSRDGPYELRVVAEDNDPSSSGLDTRLGYLYDSRAPDTLSFRADSARVAVTLADFPGGSGVNILACGLTVNTPAGITAGYTNDGDSSLFADFDPPLQPGIYAATIVAADRAGNVRTPSRLVPFLVNGPGLRPSVTAPGAPFGTAVRTAQLVQPLAFALTATDNSGAGIAWDKTTARLLDPDSSDIGGTTVVQGNLLAFQAGRLLSSNGSDDGRWRLVLHVEDLHPLTSHLDTVFSFILDNRAPDTVAVAFAPDTSSITVELTDPPSLPGRAVSGVNILGAAASVTGPSGPVAASLGNDGANRLTLVFQGGKPATPGTYTLSVTASDFAGNQATFTRAFSLNVTGTTVLFPSDSSIVRGPLFRAWTRVSGQGQTFPPGAGASLRVNRRGVPLTGTQTVVGDTLFFRFADTLAVDGRDDGRYDLIADLAVAALGERSQARGLFTVDNTPPDTSSVRVEISADGVRITAVFTDHGNYPDVAGIDRAAAGIVIEDPAGREILPVSTYWLDENTLEADFNRLETAGLHRLRLTAVDRAGWSTVRRQALVNSFGLSAGQSVAFVEEVPARTSARISFVSGRTDSRISRAVLRIFNLRGDLVRRVDVSDRIDPSGGAVNAEWLLENDRGDLVLNGVFIYSWEISYENGRREEIRKTLAVARR